MLETRTIYRSELIDFLREIPELQATIGCTQSEPHRFDVLSHTLQVVDYVRNFNDIRSYGPAGDERPYEGLTRGEILELAAWLHDIGKPETKTSRMQDGKECCISFYGHDDSGAKLCYLILPRLGLSFADTRAVSNLVELHLRPAFLARLWPQVTDHALYRLDVASREWLP